jgi:fumarate hydratase class II
VALAAQAGQLELNVMMPVIAHSLFEMMQVMIASIRMFTVKCVAGVLANRAKAERWLAKNAIVAAALNPLIGYTQATALVKEALQRELPIQEIAVEKAQAGLLKHRTEARDVAPGEIDAALKDLARLTRGGIVGGGIGG